MSDFQIYTTRIGTTDRTEIAPEDLRDAIATLTFNEKLTCSVEPPGVGPAVLLEWAEAELEEAKEAENHATHAVERKPFTATIIAKMAVECLLDWYLDSTHLGFTLRSHAGTEEKLDALDAEGLLSIGTSLFREVLFEPRNKAVHDYEGVDLKAAKHAFELARLFVRSSQQAYPPGISSAYYGPLEFARGADARRHLSQDQQRKRSRNKLLRSASEFYFGGVGAPGQHGVFFCREDEPSVCLIESCGEGAHVVRCARLSKFSPALLREVHSILERNRPALHELKPHEQQHVISSFGNAVAKKTKTQK